MPVYSEKKAITEVKSMNKGKYFDSVDRAYGFLKRLNLVKEKNVARIGQCHSDKFSKTFKKLSQKAMYGDLYKKGIEDNEYDLLLTDYSFLQFSFDEKEGVVRYAYYPNPNQFKTYDEFLNLEFESSETEVGDSYRDVYEQYVEEQTELEHVTQMRYDFDIDLYEEMIHSAAHFHFGGEDIRVSCDKILTPLSFVMLVVHYYYLPKWKEVIGDEGIRDTVLNVKSQCECIQDEYFSSDERNYFYVV